MRALASIAILASTLGVASHSAVQAADPRLAGAECKLADALASARAAYDASARRACEEFNKSVDAAIEQLGRKADLAEVERLRGTKKPPPAPLAAEPVQADEWPMLSERMRLTLRLAGTSWRGVGAGDLLTFQANGTLEPSDKSKSGWKWVALDASHVLVTYPDGWINGLKFNVDFNECRLSEYCKPREKADTWRFEK